MTQKQEKSKSLKISIPTAGRGPGGIPLVISTLDTVAAIQGTVSFESNYDCKGKEIIIKYTALAETQWSTTYNNGSSNRIRYYRGHHLYDEKTIKMGLPCPQDGKVAAGSYLCPFEFPINPSSMISSFVNPHGWMKYKVKATLIRGFPSTNIVEEQIVWVLISEIPRPERPLADMPIQMIRYNGVLKNIPYVCLIPSNLIYLGQQVPITIKMMASEECVQIDSGVVKLKEYSTFRASGGEKSGKDEILNLKVDDGWPHAETQKSWQRTIVVPFPTSPQLTPTLSSSMITKAHILKLILRAKIGDRFGTSELRVEMPVRITGPRPAGELYPCFDLHKYLASVVNI
ncbi:hypothetical protein BGZ49_010683 [Haplosporangium sp. Z 27]|nr:hypothetical protein BGZ49_010683 [Haplosporangium sp. Z 27]